MRNTCQTQSPVTGIGLHGFATLAGLLEERELEQLRDDARHQREQLSSKERTDWSVVDGWQILGPARYSYSADGDVRDAIQRQVVDRVSARSGLALVPVQSNYLYYAEGDFLGLHLDQARCQYTVIMRLDGPSEPVCMHPELAGLDAETVRARWTDDACGGVPVALEDGPLLVHGVSVPHHRRPHPFEEPLTMVTFCFRAA